MTRRPSPIARQQRLMLATFALLAAPVCAAAQEALASPGPAAPIFHSQTGVGAANPDRSQPSDPSEWRAETEAARQRHAEWLSCVLTRRFKCDAALVPVPMDALLADETLVAGDVVATPRGLKVFRGSPQIPHRWEDFQ